MNRKDAFHKGVLFHTYEMTDWLSSRVGAPREMSEALLGAWVGVLRYYALSLAERDKKFLRDIQNNDGYLFLNEKLAPKEWSSEEFQTQISHETGLLYEQIPFLLQLVGEKLHALKGEKAFEPVGWFYNGHAGNFRVKCWQDFLQPLVEAPEELIRGVTLPSSESR